MQSGFPLISFYTSYDKKWSRYHEIFYERYSQVENEGIFYRKIIPENLEDSWVHPLSLLVWYCDDGSKRTDCNAARIATQSFTYEEHEIFQRCWVKNFSLHTTLVRAGRNKKKEQMYSFSLPAKTFVEFKKLLFPFIKTHVPSMSYKCEKPRNDWGNILWTRNFSISLIKVKYEINTILKEVPEKIEKRTISWKRIKFSQLWSLFGTFEPFAMKTSFKSSNVFRNKKVESVEWISKGFCESNKQSPGKISWKELIVFIIRRALLVICEKMMV